MRRQAIDSVNTFVQQLKRTEYAAVCLHGRTNGIAHFLRLDTRCATFEFVDTVERIIERLLGQGLMRCLTIEILIDDMLASSTPENDKVEQRVRAQTIGTVHRYRRALTDCVQAIDDLGLAVFEVNDLTMVVRRNTTHLVVNGGHNGNRLFDGVNVTELDRNFTDGRQTFVDDVGTQVIKLEQDVIAIGTTPTAFLDFLIHRARNEVTRRQIFQGRRIALHEAFAIFVQQDTTFATNTFGDQNAGTGNTGGVELPELHVLQGNARARRHTQAIAGIDKRIG